MSKPLKALVDALRDKKQEIYKLSMAHLDEAKVHALDALSGDVTARITAKEHVAKSEAYSDACDRVNELLQDIITGRFDEQEVAEPAPRR